MDIDKIKEVCEQTSKRVENAYDGLTLHFVIYPHGKMKENIALAEHDIVLHPAGETARKILRQNNNGEKSSFLGLAIANESKYLGLKSKDHLVGLYTLNTSEFKDMTEVRAHIYHSAWHAIDLYDIRKIPQYRKKFRVGEMIPKRTALNLSKANLQADVFSMLLMALEKEERAIDILGALRAKQAVTSTIGFKAEDYPSVLAIESCKVAYADLQGFNLRKSEYMARARDISIEIGQTYDEENIRQWWNFTIPAQDMAWRDFSQEDILGAAVNTSLDPFVRSTGLLVSETSHIEPSEAITLDNGYNAFLDPDNNLNLHREIVDKTFADAIEQGIKESSHRALLNAANAQNEALTNGKILGWCANALQEAAAAFERSLISGTAPEQAAKMQFESKRDEPEWEDLKKLSNTIIEQKRQGLTITMGHIAEICNNHIAFSPMLNAVTMTMKDPAYIQKLEAANDFGLIPAKPLEPTFAGPSIKGPGPKAPQKELEYAVAPTMAAARAAPSLGGSKSNNDAARAMYQKHMDIKKKREEIQREQEMEARREIERQTDE